MVAARWLGNEIERVASKSSETSGSEKDRQLV